MTPAKKAVPTLSELTQKKNDNTPVEDKPVSEVDENTDREENDPGYLEDAEVEDSEEEDDVFLSLNVVSTVPNKTPAELAAETPEETAARYGVDTSITKKDANNPRVQVYKDTHVRQVPSGTHLHPDIAKDLLNRGISEHTTDNAQVKRTITETYDFAPDAETNDKF